MGRASFVVVEPSLDGVFLYRYGRDGNCVGESWHMNVEDAKDQANYEYEGQMAECTKVPPEVEDVVAFGLARLQQP
jgi:hypothetical protein